MPEPDIAWENDLLTLYENGSLSVSDGVGFVGVLPVEEVASLYYSLQEVFDSMDSHDE